jgi:hypothetical protein
MRRTDVEATPATVNAVDEPFTIRRFEIDEEALFTISAPDTVRAVVEAFVRVLLVEVRVPTLRFVIVEEAALAMNPPVKYARPVVVAAVTERDVGEKLVAERFTTFRLLIDDDAAFTIRPPLKYESSDEVAAPSVTPPLKA